MSFQRAARAALAGQSGLPRILVAIVVVSLAGLSLSCGNSGGSGTTGGMLFVDNPNALGATNGGVVVSGPANTLRSRSTSPVAGSVVVRVTCNLRVTFTALTKENWLKLGSPFWANAALKIDAAEIIDDIDMVDGDYSEAGAGQALEGLLQRQAVVPVARQLDQGR